MKKIEKVLLVVFVPATLFLLFIVTAGAGTKPDDQFNSATFYKSKCFACHGAKAEKKFDAAKSDDEHIQIILKGKKAEKPPNMPGYEDKGVTADQAKALLEYMKSLRQ